MKSFNYLIMKRIIQLQLIAAALMIGLISVSCERKLDSKVPTDNINISVEFAGFAIDRAGFSSELKCVKTPLENGWVVFENERAIGTTSVNGIYYTSVYMVDVNGSNHNGFKWEGLIELEGTVKDGENTVLRYKLYVEGNAAKDSDGEQYCTPTVVRAEILEGDYTCSLSSNAWVGRTSSTAVLKIRKKN